MSLQGWKLWALVGGIAAALVVIPALFAALSSGDGGGESPPSSNADRPAPADPRQQAYDALLGQARQNVREDPDLNCDLDYQQLVIDQVDATGAQKALIQLAMGDACIEAGEWEGGVYSRYHGNTD